jgi:hypothetical protein
LRSPEADAASDQPPSRALFPAGRLRPSSRALLSARPPRSSPRRQKLHQASFVSFCDGRNLLAVGSFSSFCITRQP